MNWETGTDIYTSLCVKQITNCENLLYSTGNYTQCSVVTYLGRKLKKTGDICTRVANSLCCAAETNTML